MSKTDKTRPWKLQAIEQPMYTCVPVHFHEDGVCDLPEDPALAFGCQKMGSCYWAEGPGFWYGLGGGAGCGCAGCTRQAARRAARRAVRHEGTRVCREALKVYVAGGIEAVEDLDVYVRTPRALW